MYNPEEEVQRAILIRSLRRYDFYRDTIAYTNEFFAKKSTPELQLMVNAATTFTTKGFPILMMKFASKAILEAATKRFSLAARLLKPENIKIAISPEEENLLLQQKATIFETNLYCVVAKNILMSAIGHNINNLFESAVPAIAETPIIPTSNSSEAKKTMHSNNVFFQKFSVNRKRKSEADDVDEVNSKKMRPVLDEVAVTSVPSEPTINHAPTQEIPTTINLVPAQEISTTINLTPTQELSTTINLTPTQTTINLTPTQEIPMQDIAMTINYTPTQEKPTTPTLREIPTSLNDRAHSVVIEELPSTPGSMHSSTSEPVFEEFADAQTIMENDGDSSTISVNRSDVSSLASAAIDSQRCITPPVGVATHTENFLNQINRGDRVAEAEENLYQELDELEKIREGGESKNYTVLSDAESDIEDVSY